MEPLGREQVKRYGPRTMESGSQGDYYTIFDECTEGKWVSFNDYAALRQRLEEVERENVKLRGFKKHVEESLNSGDGSYRP